MGSSVHIENGSGGPGGFGRCQIHDRGRDFLRLCDPSEGGSARECRHLRGRAVVPPPVRSPRIRGLRHRPYAVGCQRDPSGAPSPDSGEMEEEEATPAPGGQPPALSESPSDVEPAGTPSASTPQPEVTQLQAAPASTWMKVAAIAAAAGIVVAVLAALYFSNRTRSATNEELGLTRRTAQSE